MYIRVEGDVKPSYFKGSSYFPVQIIIAYFSAKIAEPASSISV